MPPAMGEREVRKGGRDARGAELSRRVRDRLRKRCGTRPCPGVLGAAASPQQPGERRGVVLGWGLANRAEPGGCPELRCWRAGLPRGDSRAVKSLTHG